MIRLRITALLLFALLLSCLSAEAAVRICNIGDSITEGSNGEYTARYYLWHKLRAAGHDVDFVGQRWGVSWGQPASYDFDADHEGRFGWRIDQVTSEGFQNTEYNVWLEGLGSTIKRFQMDIALVFLGHNDIFQGESTAQLIADMRAHIALLRQYNPQVDIFLAQPFSGGGASYEKIRQWALAVPALAAELNTAQSRVIAVDFWNSACGSHTYDTTHPTDTGYRLMADVWFAALDPFLRNNQATVANGVYQIVARHSGLCLDAFGSTDGSSVGQWTSHGESNQRWRLTNVGENQYKIEEQRSFRALDVAGWSTQNGGAVHLWNYGGGANQKWTLTPTSSGYYKIESVHSGKALDVAEVSTSPGALVHQWIYVGGQNQEWRLQAP